MPLTMPFNLGQWMERQKDAHLLNRLSTSNHIHPKLHQQPPQSSTLNLLLAMHRTEYPLMLNARRCWVHQHRQPHRTVSRCLPQAQYSQTMIHQVYRQPLYRSTWFQSEIPPPRCMLGHRAELERHRTIYLSAIVLNHFLRAGSYRYNKHILKEQLLQKFFM